MLDEDDSSTVPPTELQLHTSLSCQNAILDAMPDIAWLKDRDGRFLAVNAPFSLASGLAASDVIGKSDLDIWPQPLAESYIACDAEVMRTRSRLCAEERLVGADGRERWVETIRTPILDDHGSVIGTTGIARDITEPRQMTATLRHVTRLYAFLSQINQAIIRTTSRDELFQTICRVAIEAGEFRFAWVGLVDETIGSVHAVAQAGHEDGYLSRAKIIRGSGPRGGGPTGAALQSGSIITCDDIATDARMSPWRDDALQRGYRSSAAVPFRLHGRIVGTLNLYAAETGFFTDDERALLAGLGVDISFALDALEAERNRLAATDALQQSEARYRTLFETMAQGVVYQDADGRITSANPAAERILGVSLDQLQGRTSMDPRWRAVKSDGTDFPGDEHPAMLALRTGKPVLGVIMGVFHPNSGADRWILVDAIPEYHPGQSKPHQVYTTFTDITERHVAEESLLRRNQALAALLEVSKSLVATLDLASVLQATTAGATGLFGVDSAAVYLLETDRLRLCATTPPLQADFPEEFRTAALADHPHVQAALESGAPIFLADVDPAALTPAERRIAERRGLRSILYLPLLAGANTIGTLIVGSRCKPWVASAADIDLCRTLANLAAVAAENARLFDAGREYAAALERTLADRTRVEQERLELERQLLHAQKLESLGVLAGGIAHDFNNLLMAILGNLDLALQRLSPVSPAREYLKQSAAAARRATDLTRQMLAYSGRGRFLVRVMDLNELVRENAHLFRASVTKTASFELLLGESLPCIEADAGQVQQVVMNLLTNAAEAIGDRPGRIVLTTGVQDCDARRLQRSRIEETPPAGLFVFLEVSDTGAGMDKQTKQRLFDPFFTTKAAGRGLGMSAILGIVRGHRGAVFVDSAPGCGSKIRILFPAVAASRAATTAETETPTGTAETPALHGTVLVVDDEEMAGQVCREMVMSFGLQVLSASDGREAVEVFRRHADRISTVILDLTMPHMDGVTTFEELARIRPGVKVILCSGYSEQDAVHRLSAQGLVTFLQKPYSLDSLREALERAARHVEDAAGGRTTTSGHEEASP